ncbi:MAG: hypothetical protein Q8O48_09915, partial [Anaerolineales bacterium]|nr:hypothetical protein [Anaerolineales bacterium]
MKKLRTSLPLLRGLTVQLFAITVLPLTLLLLVIAFGSYSLHQRDMRTLVGERDERSAQSAAAALESELHHRMATISSMAAFAEASKDLTFEKILSVSNDQTSDFDGGIAFFNSNGRLIANTDHDELWGWVAQNASNLPLASSSDASAPLSTSFEPVFSDPFVDPNSKRLFVIISVYSSERGLIAAGAFSPERLAEQALFASYAAGNPVTIYLLDPSRQVLFVSGTSEIQGLPANHSGVAEALRG